MVFVSGGEVELTRDIHEYLKTEFTVDNLREIVTPGKYKVQEE